MLAGCNITPSVQKIALLAPFEGRYREIGYEALYASRLAIADSAVSSIDLLPLDDGGSIATARLRAEALIQDPAIVGALLVGPFSTHTDVQAQLETLPVIIVGHWQTAPANENTVLLAQARISEQVTTTDPLLPDTLPAGEIIGGEIFGLAQVTQRYDDPSQLSILTSGQLPSDEFAARYQESDSFAPEARLIAPLAYDATAIMLTAVQAGQALHDIQHQGINGDIQFQRGYWTNAPINRLSYDETGTLIQLD